MKWLSNAKRPNVNSKTWLVLSSLLLASCQSVPTACPRLPELPVLEPLEQSFQEQMRLFLQGGQPVQTTTQTKPGSVTKPTTEPSKR